MILLSSSRFNSALLFAAAGGSALSAEAALTQRETLLRFYHLANGDHWRTADGWYESAEAAAVSEFGVPNLVGPDVCTWHGVECDENDDVVGLRLDDNNLSGRVSRHLWTLPRLRAVNLRGNLIKDAGLQGLSDDDESSTAKSPVEVLDLSGNRLETVEGIGSAPGTLRELRIGSNAFEGRFPDEIFKLAGLKILAASYNAGFVGTLSAEIGNMSNLRELSISFSDMHGDIPSEIGNLSRLEFLSLDDNRFKGPLPRELENLSELKYLSITNTESYNGAITGPLPSFKTNRNLRELYLNDNRLTGAVPSDLLADSLLTDAPIAVSVANNRITGKLPAELARFEKLHFEAGGNRINGVPNVLCTKKKWQHGNVHDFGCDAILCPRGTFASSGRRETENEKCEVCPNGVDDAPHFGSVKCLGAPWVDSDGGGATVSSSAAASSSDASSQSSSSGMSGGAKFATVFFSVAAFVALIASFAWRDINRRRDARVAFEEAELDRHERNGVVMYAADAGHNADLGEAGMLDVPLGGPNGPSSPGVDRCIL